ncbi:hypothetical protein D9611_001270 [Ephemerocybe angulata]|uniref:Fork-head domain-containing protein n=1 Tax=Ephemerocybe angulata TaxID=980116 RepID=A0A8H5FMG1_9AGAR|nr:hypothetical protein D9611_001270 [Tulosesus angulatus]
MAILSKNVARTALRLGCATEMSQRPVNSNIYHGALSPLEPHQTSQPVQYAPTGNDGLSHEDTPYLQHQRRGTYPPADARNQMMLTTHDIYGQQDYRVHHTQGLNMPGPGPMLGNPYSQPQFSPNLDPRFALSTSPLSDQSFNASRHNPMSYAFPGHGLPHHSGGRPQMHGSHSYPPPGIDPTAQYMGLESIPLTEQHFENNSNSNHALPAPGDFLRQKLGLKPGDPVNLWSLPDPEPGQRPPHSYPLLVRLAIYGSPNQRMTLKQIYEAIEERFEFYRTQPKGAWRGSIRHNLSLNQVFKNVHRPLTEPGKGNYWEIDHSKGEGYKRDRKRKSRKTTSGAVASEEEEQDFDDLSGCEFEVGMVDSDQSDASQGSMRRASSRASRRASPYASSSANAGTSPSSRRARLPNQYVGSSAQSIDQAVGGMGATDPSSYYLNEVPSSPEGSTGYHSGSSYGSSHSRRGSR